MPNNLLKVVGNIQNTILKYFLDIKNHQIKANLTITIFNFNIMVVDRHKPRI